MKSKKGEEKYLIENHFFKRFSDLYFRNSITETIKAEAPDFLVKTEVNLVGVEVRQICNQKSENEQYTLIEKYKFENDIIGATKAYFESSNYIPLNIRFNFVDEFYLPQRDIIKLAKKLSEIIQEQMLVKELGWQQTVGLLPKKVLPG